MKLTIRATLILFFLQAGAFANPYLPKPGERPLSLRISTCAVSGGFVHLYTALDNGLFDKYGMKLENIFVRGSAQNLVALASDEVQFTYCAADGTIPGLASGIEAKLIASPLVKLPTCWSREKKSGGRRTSMEKHWVSLARRFERPAVARGGEKFGIPQRRSPSGPSVAARGTLSGDGRRVDSRSYHYPTPRRAREERRLQPPLPPDRSQPAFIYSSLHTSYKMLRDRPEIVQRMVAAFAEIVYFVEKNPDKAKASIAKAMRTKDPEALQSAYDVYARDILDRTMVVPGKSVADAVDLAAKAAPRSGASPKSFTTIDSSTIWKRADS